MLKIGAAGAAFYSFLFTSWCLASPGEIAIMLCGLVVPLWLAGWLVRTTVCALRCGVGLGLLARST